MAKKTEYGLYNPDGVQTGAITANESGGYTFRDYRGNEGPMSVSSESTDPATGRKTTRFASGWKLEVDPANPTVGAKITTPNGTTMTPVVKTVGGNNAQALPAADSVPIKRGFAEDLPPGANITAPPPTAPPPSPERNVTTSYPMGTSGNKFVTVYNTKTDKTSYAIEGKDGKRTELTVANEENLKQGTTITFTNGGVFQKPSGFSGGLTAYTPPRGKPIELGTPDVVEKGGYTNALSEALKDRALAEAIKPSSAAVNQIIRGLGGGKPMVIEGKPMVLEGKPMGAMRLPDDVTTLPFIHDDEVAVIKGGYIKDDLASEIEGKPNGEMRLPDDVTTLPLNRDDDYLLADGIESDIDLSGTFLNMAAGNKPTVAANKGLDRKMDNANKVGAPNPIG